MVNTSSDIKDYNSGLPFILSGTLLKEGRSSATEIYYTVDFLNKVLDTINKLWLDATEKHRVDLYFSLNKTLQNISLDPILRVGHLYTVYLEKNDSTQLTELKLRFLITDTERAQSLVNLLHDYDLNKISFHASLLVAGKIFRNSRYEVDLSEEIEINYFDIFIEDTKVR